ncbi:hypothetical protein ACGFIF_38155 [Kribbella sp. NPDC049174]|uniref:hypothetical protein n=1 Tax=Kribbella sp. NPDC049174 TaxID=3364112 RepID=UPI00371BA454
MAVLDQYAGDLARADLTAQARRTYLSRVRMYLAWLADAAVDGNPLTDQAGPRRCDSSVDGGRSRYTFRASRSSTRR